MKRVYRLYTCAELLTTMRFICDCIGWCVVGMSLCAFVRLGVGWAAPFETRELDRWMVRYGPWVSATMFVLAPLLWLLERHAARTCIRILPF